MSQVKERNSIFELMRIIAMFIIVTYHLFLFSVAPHYPNEPFYKGIQIPLHIGVILFVLISGYFGIKCSFKGLFKLIMMVAIYYLPIELSTDYFFSGGDFKQIIKDCLFISHSPYWFIRTYICLYIFSPVLNAYLKEIKQNQLTLLIVSLGFISIYLGTSMGDISLYNGTNLINFSFIYIIGYTLKVYKHKWNQCSNKVLIPLFLMLNLLLVTLYCISAGSIISKILWKLSFPYCSPFLMINAIFVFIIVAKFHLHSKLINTIASSIFAVYLIHCQPFIEKVIIVNVTRILDVVGNNIMYTIVSVIIIAFLIMIVCVMIDKCLSPLWKYIDVLADKIWKRILQYIKTLINI